MPKPTQVELMFVFDRGMSEDEQRAKLEASAAKQQLSLTKKFAIQKEHLAERTEVAVQTKALHHKIRLLRRELRQTKRSLSRKRRQEHTRLHKMAKRAGELQLRLSAARKAAADALRMNKLKQRSERTKIRKLRCVVYLQGLAHTPTAPPLDGTLPECLPPEVEVAIPVLCKKGQYC